MVGKLGRDSTANAHPTCRTGTVNPSVMAATGTWSVYWKVGGSFFVYSVSFDPDAGLDVYLVAAAFAGQLWSAAVSEPDVTGVEGSGK